MKRSRFDQWVPFGFAVALAAIVVVTYVATRQSEAWIPAFFCFFPMTFFFVGASLTQARKEIHTLEQRIQQLETQLRMPFTP